ncbi:TonB-dependent receptor [Peristeroidobacter soli]|uniref:TonB-dependent receptor n=1 Tax=Peristeroidobacter soli TaxID=2497877 RepID=UPI00101D1676|nr:TonB-dependent receptor [Peristeroidobacter soli]
MKLHAPVVATLLGLSLHSPSGQAQDTNQTGGGLEEVIVTATKRSESIQDVPVSIRALGEQELRRMGADSLEDYAGVTPGLQLTGTRNNSQIIVRGVTTGPVNHDQTEIKETVGVYLDETPIAVQRYSPNLKLFDLERIEVLRGPQGTLYGAGSMAGAIRMITRKPQLDRVAGEVRGMMSSTEHGSASNSFDAMLNVPLIDDVLAMRAVGFYRDVGGFIDNVATGDDDANSELSRGGRVATRWTPNETLTVDSLVFFQQSDFRAISQYAAEAGELKTYVAENEPVHDRNLIVSLSATQQLDPLEVTAVGSYRRKKLQYFSENGTFTNFITGFRDGLGGTFDNRSNQRDYSFELRAASKSDSWLQWTVGAFYEDRTNFYSQDYTVAGVDAVAGIDSRDFDANIDQLYFSNIDVKENQVALFGEVVFPLTDALKLTAGGRYFRAEQQADITFLGVFAYPNIGVGRFKNDEDGFNPRVNLSYAIDRDRMVYVQAARGFRLGGTNEPIPQPACTADLQSRGLSNAPDSFDSDHLWNFEVGTKTDWLDRRLTVNVAAYKIDWKKPQVTDQLGCGFNVFVNAGGLDIYGAEVETIVRPTDYLTVRGGAGYTDSTLNEDLVFVGGREGDRAPYVPKWTYSASLDYTRPLGQSFEGFAFLSYQHTGARDTRFNPSVAASRHLDSYGLLNARIGINAANWSVELFGENLTDELGEIDKRYNPYPLTPATYVTVVTPRTVGLEVTYRY